MHDQNLPQTSQEYITCFRQLAAITNDAMNYVENNPPIYLASLDRIAQSVETIASLRGDSGIYASSRPDGLVMYQKEMYELEDYLRNRLIGLGYAYPAPRSISATV